MSITTDSLASEKSDSLCSYFNSTSKIQVLRITNIPNWYFERVVFPGQQLIFPAQPEALLEIHSGAMASSILSDTIPCKKLLLDAPTQDDLADYESIESAIAS